MTLTAQEERILKRFNEISLSAHMIELNVLLAKKSKDDAKEWERRLDLALEDIRMIHQDLTRFDYIWKKDDDDDES